jgi:hypothetical protein
MPTEKDKILCEMARVLRDGRSRMPSVTFEQACEQVKRSLEGMTAAPASGGSFGPLQSSEGLSENTIRAAG